MKTLIACEFSGEVRNAFTAKGHFAVSCDYLPSETPGNHYQGDVRDLLKERWDLIIAHPPCTYLCNSGVRWLMSDTERWKQMIEAACFFRSLLEVDCPRIAVENPIMHKYAAQIVGRRQDQVIQPYQFGHPERKATCLWLKGLPKLQATNDVQAEMLALPVSQQQRIFHIPPSEGRWKERSKTFRGVAEAMSEQWG